MADKKTRLVPGYIYKVKEGAFSSGELKRFHNMQCIFTGKTENDTALVITFKTGAEMLDKLWVPSRYLEFVRTSSDDVIFEREDGSMNTGILLNVSSGKAWIATNINGAYDFISVEKGKWKIYASTVSHMNYPVATDKKVLLL